MEEGMYKLVEKQYKENYSRLGEYYKLHFASRLYLWSQDNEATKWIENLQEKCVGKEKRKFFYETFQEGGLLKRKETFSKSPLKTLRKEAFRKYPELNEINRDLFRVIFSLSLYREDFRDDFLRENSEEKLEKMSLELQKDEKAVSILATHAVNFLYLYHRGIKNEEGFNVEKFFEIAHSQYSKENDLHTQLHLYLYTHCIIGETMFYSREIPLEKKRLYTKMLRELEEIIAKKYFTITLDNKLEFLVCCRTVEYKTFLEEVIYSETSVSLSKEGDFLIDRYNTKRDGEIVSFERSEHRNVLFLMSHRKFSPQKKGR